jgi:hypothetical protein
MCYLTATVKAIGSLKSHCLYFIKIKLLYVIISLTDSQNVRTPITHSTTLYS